MTKGILIALTNPVSPEREAEFNHWYNIIHGSEVGQLRGFAAMTRYKAEVQAVPPSENPTFGYLAIYDLDDIEEAMRSLAAGTDRFQMSDSVDLAHVLGIGFKKIFSTRDQADSG
jgi:hypothetical protein